MEMFKSCLVLAISFPLVAYGARINQVKDECPADWVDATSMDLGCLLFNSTTAYTWEKAYGYCRSVENASLIDILTEEQLDFVRLKLYDLEEQNGKELWWTGATDLGREGQWTWMGGLTPVSEFIWRAGYPNGGVTENCLYLNSGGSYEGYDNPCSILYHPICMKM